MRKACCIYCDFCGNEIKIDEGETVFGDDRVPGKDICAKCVYQEDFENGKNDEKD